MPHWSNFENFEAFFGLVLRRGFAHETINIIIEEAVLPKFGAHWREGDEGVEPSTATA